MNSNIDEQNKLTLVANLTQECNSPFYENKLYNNSASNE